MRLLRCGLVPIRHNATNPLGSVSIQYIAYFYGTLPCGITHRTGL